MFLLFCFVGFVRALRFRLSFFAVPFRRSPCARSHSLWLRFASLILHLLLLQTCQDTGVFCSAILHIFLWIPSALLISSTLSSSLVSRLMHLLLESDLAAVVHSEVCVSVRKPCVEILSACPVVEVGALFRACSLNAVCLGVCWRFSPAMQYFAVTSMHSPSQSRP